MFVNGTESGGSFEFIGSTCVVENDGPGKAVHTRKILVEVGICIVCVKHLHIRSSQFYLKRPANSLEMPLGIFFSPSVLFSTYLKK